jgi:hypothetical protein
MDFGWKCFKYTYSPPKTPNENPDNIQIKSPDKEVILSSFTDSNSSPQISVHKIRANGK